jgi:hypothetical protein
MTALPADRDFSPLRGIFEPSGIQQLPDGRFLVIEDEKEFPFSIFALGQDGRLAGDPLPLAAPEKLNDLEGLSLGPSGHLYAITSHSRDGDADVKKSRRRLVRFRVEGNAIVDFSMCGDLLPALAGADPALADAARVADVKSDGGLNVEALEMSPDGKELLVGLRGPLIGGQAVAAAIADPDSLFEGPGSLFDAALDALLDRGSKVQMTIRRVNLGGQGFRSLAWIPALDAYLVVSGPLGREKQDFGLWLWNGVDAAARRVTISGATGVARTEGVTAAEVGGRRGVLLVSDDGDRAAGRFANHLLVDLARLAIAAR